MFAAKNVLLTGAKKAPVVFKSATYSDSTSITLPSHVAGDIIVIFAGAPWYQAITKPAAGGTVPSWTTIRGEASGTEYYTFVGYAVATASNHTSGTWGNTYNMQAAVLSGQGASPIGGSVIKVEWSNTPYMSRPTMTNTNGTSQLLHFCSGFPTFTNAFSLAGYTGRTAAANIAHRLITKDDTTSAGSSDPFMGGTTTGSGVYKWWSATVEIVN